MPFTLRILRTASVYWSAAALIRKVLATITPDAAGVMNTWLAINLLAVIAVGVGLLLNWLREGDSDA